MYGKASRHETKDLAHDLQHRLELVVAEEAHGMGAGATGLPVEGFDLMAEHIAVGLRPIQNLGVCSPADIV